MEYQRFIAKTYQEAHAEAKRQFGEDAYILKNNTIVKKKFFGLKRDKYVELLVGARSIINIGLKTKSGSTKNISQLSMGNDLNGVSSVNTLERELKLKKFENMLLHKQNKLGINHLTNTNAMTSVERDHVEKVVEEKKQNGLDSSIDVTDDVDSFLEEYDFRDPLREKIIREYPFKQVNSDEEKIQMADIIVSYFLYNSNIKIYATNPNVVFIVGATGVGKTTTLAKITTKYVMEEGKGCVLATFDIRRILAAAQLEKYASILGIPFKVLFDGKEIKSLITKHINEKIIFIDTAGAGQNELSFIDELSDVVNYNDIPKEVHLCINASMRFKDIKNVLGSFESVKYDRIILTKSDESYSMGSALSAIYPYNIPISFFSNGQDVPHDIVSASSDELKKLLLKEWK